MPTKKSTKQKSVIRKTAKEIEHYNGVLIEGLVSKFDLVIDAVKSVETSLTRRMDESDARNERRFQDIEGILKLHTKKFEENDRRWEQNEKRWEQNEKRWEQNDERWEQNDKRWEQNDERWEQNATRWEETDRKLESIITKLDKVVEKVERHEDEIEEIKNHLHL